MAPSIRTRSFARALAVIATTSACSEPDPYAEPDFVWRGEHLDIRGHGVEPTDYCGGTFAHMDAYMGEVASLFEYEGPRPVLSIGPAPFMDQHCPDGRTGCARYSNAFILAERVPLDHELVHVATGTTTCPMPLAEGLAVYFSMAYGYHDVPTEEIGAALRGALWPDGVLESGHYGLVGHFVGFLIETRDLAQVLELCEVAGPYAQLEQFEAAFTTVFGSSLDQLITEYDDYPRCSTRETSRKLLECDQALDATLDLGQTIELDFEIDCANSVTLGPRTIADEPDRVWVNRRVRIEPWLYPHVVRLRASDASTGDPVPAFVTFLPCGRCIDGIQSTTIDLPEGVSPLALPSVRAGEYVVEVRQALEASTPIVLTIESVE